MADPSWDMSNLAKGWTIKDKIVAPVDLDNMNEFLQLIMNLESRGGKDAYQESGDPNNRGAGLFQLETGPDQGGMTRLTRAYTHLPANLTPSAMKRHYKESTSKDRSYDVKARLTADQQKFLMMTNIMLPKGGRAAYDKWVSSGKDEDKFLDWWLDHHWAGHKGDFKVRETKKNWAKDHLKDYRKKDDASFFFPDDGLMPGDIPV